MLAIARRQRRPVEYGLGDALALPFADEHFDVAVCTQVYEYVDDIAAALAEARRVLRPGGRLLVLDTDWDSIVWHSSDRERMERVLAAWNEHLADPYLPRRLPGLMRAAGLEPTASAIIPILNVGADRNTYSAGMIGLVAAYVAGRGGVSEARRPHGSRTSPASATTTSSASTATCSSLRDDRFRGPCGRMAVSRGCWAVHGEGEQCHWHGPLRRVPIQRRGAPPGGRAGRGIGHLQSVGEVGQHLGAVLGDQHEVLEPDAAEALAVAPGLERDRRRRRRGRRGVRPRFGPLVDLEADAVAERVEVPVVELAARRLAQLRRLAGALERLARERRRSRRPSAPARTAANELSSASRASRQYSASSSGGSPPPATNVRVMSAQQRETRSRGQMSTITPSPAPIGPWPGSWPTAPCAPWETITSSARSQPRLVADGLHRRAHVLAGEPGPQLVDQLGAERHRRVGGLLRAPDAVELRRRLHAPACARTRRGRPSPRCRRRAGGRRRRAGTPAARPRAGHRAARTRAGELEPRSRAASAPAAISSSAPSVVRDR